MIKHKPLKRPKWANLWQNLNFRGHLSTFRAESQPNSKLFNALSEHFLHNSRTPLKKCRIRLFRSENCNKNDPSERTKWAKFWPKISIFGVIYQPFKLKIHPKVGLLRPKTMPKHFLNNSKTTLKKSRIRLFWPPKWPKMTPQNGQNEQIFDRKFWFSRSFMDLWSWKYTQKWAFSDQKQCLNTS